MLKLIRYIFMGDILYGISAGSRFIKRMLILSGMLLLLTSVMVTNVQGQKKIEKELNRIIKKAEVPGMQVMHVKKGKSKTYCVGEKEYDSGDKVTAATLFQACSLSKSVMAYAALRLYDKGLFALDTPLEHYWVYPRLSEEPEGKKITARMVLTHTSGLPNWTHPRGAKLKVAFEPGTGYRYSGEGYYFLQKVLEHLTHKSLEEIAEEEVFKPLGMKHSHYIYKDDMFENYAHGHDDLKPRSLKKYKKANAAYSLITDAADYTTFVQKALIKGEGLTPHTHKMMLDSASSRKPHLNNGLGVQMQRNEKGKAIYHNGSNPGFRCFYFAYPATGESLVCFTNSSNGVKVKRRVARLLLGDQTFWCF